MNTETKTLTPELLRRMDAQGRVVWSPVHIFRLEEADNFRNGSFDFALNLRQNESSMEYFDNLLVSPVGRNDIIPGKS